MFDSLARVLQLSALRRRFEALAPRERRLMAAGAAAGALALLYSGTTALLDFRAEAVARYAAEREDLEWMRVYRPMAEEAAQRSGDGGGEQGRLSAVNAAAKELDLPLHRIQPESGGITVQIEAQPFDKVIRWTQALVAQHDIEIINANVDLHEQGVVNARFGIR